MNVADTIKALEALRIRWTHIERIKAACDGAHDSVLLGELATLDAALTHFRQQETMPEKSHCACKFSSGGVLSKSCEFHERMKEATVRRCAEICKRRGESDHKMAAMANQCEADILAAHGLEKP